ncbi:hypothetical protein [Streptomyces sp. NPDC006368]|uniref:hypothetical protein n=1 Tax=Streptomyces sp. NPDC006368 TaxID=3156760 RepID=UPI0033BEE531
MTTPAVVARPDACVARSSSQAAGAHRFARDVVPASSHRHQQVVLTGEGDGLQDVGRSGAAGDQRGPVVDLAVPDRTRLLVRMISRAEQPAAQPHTQALDSRFVHARLVAGSRLHL